MMADPLVDAISEQLRLRGSARSSPGEPAGPWRSAARAAARSLGRPVETIEHGGIAHAALRDWPANELEEQIQRKALRRAVEAVADHTEQT